MFLIHEILLTIPPPLYPRPSHKRRKSRGQMSRTRKAMALAKRGVQASTIQVDRCPAKLPRAQPPVPSTSTRTPTPSVMHCQTDHLRAIRCTPKVVLLHARSAHRKTSFLFWGLWCRKQTMKIVRTCPLRVRTHPRLHCSVPELRRLPSFVHRGA